MEQEEKNRLARLGNFVSGSCVIAGMFQGWNTLHPVTGSYKTENEAWEALADRVRRNSEEFAELMVVRKSPKI